MLWTAVLAGVVPVADAAADYRSTVMDTPGLVDYWRLGEIAGVGWDAADEKGTITGTYLGMPGLGTPGLIDADPNPGMLLDGIDDNVRLPDGPSLDVSTGATWEMWMVKEGGASCNPYLFYRNVRRAAGL